MKIGLDFDGVIANNNKLKSEAAKLLFDLDIPPDRFKKEILVEENILTLNQYRKLQKFIYDPEERSNLKMDPVEGVLTYLPKIISEGYEILVVTSRSKDSIPFMKTWSKNINLNLNFIALGYGKSKKSATADLDLYVDDDLDKLLDLTTPNRILFSWKYNSHLTDLGTIKRVDSWNELYNFIKKSGR